MHRMQQDESYKAACKSVRHKIVCVVEQEIDNYTEVDIQIDMVKMTLLTLMQKAQIL